MTRQEFYKLTNDNIVILDGATGSMLQKAGMNPGYARKSGFLGIEMK